jgi:uncharacterized membrane protein
MINWRRIFFGLAVKIMVFGTGTAFAATYTFTDINYPGASETQAWGINNSGQIVGFYPSSSVTNAYHGFLKTDDTYTSIDAQPNYWTKARSTQVWGINNSGQIVGSAVWPNLYLGFYTKADESYNPLYGGAHAIGIISFGINNSGQIVGFYYDNLNYLNHGFFYDPNTNRYDAIGPFGGLDFFPFDLNDSGQIVGYNINSGALDKSYLVEGSTSTRIAYPGASATQVVGISNSGQIVGSWFDPNNSHWHGFLKTGGTYTTIDYPGTTDTFLRDINDSGQIVGGWQDSSGQHSFLASPVPLPSALILLGAGLLCLTSFMRRKN